jgi:3',5'-cyclic AMP phosphodiesterase CpdA
MKRLVLVLFALGLLAAAVALSRGPSDGAAGREAPGDLRAPAGDRNPWTNLRVNRRPDQFQFAVVSDRTGSHRAGVFSRAVEQLNLLQPEFVLSVGDLIEGSPNAETARAEWRELRGYVGRLQMPFFYAPGNHDVLAKGLAELWGEQFGRRYYHFVYKGVLFVVLNLYEASVTPPGGKPSRGLGPEQLAWLGKVLADNADARWTVVTIHAPAWTFKDGGASGWPDAEKLLANRKYTVFCGHVHIYRKYVRQGMSYYQLATTGGGSSLRGPEYGEFDQVAWVTMKPDGPVLANLALDGVLRDDLTRPATDEPGRNAGEATAALLTRAGGAARYRGKPPAGATVTFTPVGGVGALVGRPAAGRVEADGTFRLYQDHGPEGLPPGDYRVTVTWRDPLPEGGYGPDRLPAKYADPKTSGLRATVTALGKNQFEFDLED